MSTIQENSLLHGGKTKEGTVGGTPTGAGETPALPGIGVSRAIGAGADREAKFQFASGEMPSPQADVAGFFGRTA